MVDRGTGAERRIIVATSFLMTTGPIWQQLGRDHPIRAAEGAIHVRHEPARDNARNRV